MNYDPLSDLYQLQYANYREDINFYLKLSQRVGANKILELGAGSGRISIPLAKQGIKVTALEPSTRMQEFGRSAAQANNVKIDFISADARNFSLNEKYPLIIAPFNMLMHLYTIKDQNAALECIKQQLEPGGIFAFDLYQPKFGLEGVLRHEDETFTLKNGDKLDVFLLQRIDKLMQIVTTTYYCDTMSLDKTLKREIIELKQRYYTKYELERWLSDFRLEWNGDFTGSRLNADSHYFVVTTYYQK